MAFGQHVVAGDHAGEEQRPGDGREDPGPLPLGGVQPRQDERPDLVEPVGAGGHDGDHPAQLELEQQRAGDVVDDRLGLDRCPQPLTRVVVGDQDELEELFVEEQGDPERHDHDQRRAQQPRAQLAQVVGQGHPAIGTDRVLGPASEEAGQTLDQGRGWIRRSRRG